MSFIRKENHQIFEKQLNKYLDNIICKYMTRRNIIFRSAKNGGI